MRYLIAHWLLSALLLWLVSLIVPGIYLAGVGAALLAALVLGIANTLVRPLLLLITLPITILTLGLFLIVINALMLLLTSAIVGGFRVHGFGSAALAGLVLGVFNLLASVTLRRISKR
jgi:putative membrane protein